MRKQFGKPRKPVVGRSSRGFRWNKKFRRAYDRFINSPEWKRIRHAKLVEANWCCEDCTQRPPKLATQVHHETYARFGGQELLTDLRALCEECHKLIHRTKKQHGGLWFSTRVAAEHAMTQFGVDIREQLLKSYDH